MPPKGKATGPRITRGAVSSRLDGKTFNQRKRVKRGAFVDAPKPGKFSRDGVEIEILSVVPFGDDGIEIDARVFRNGAEVPLGNLLPFRIVNPPILVPDGTKSTVAVPFGNGTTKDAQVDNYREDVSAALEAIVAEHVRVHLK